MFDNGNVYADIYTCKNAYDSMYSMNMSSEGRLDNCRDYIGMMTNGNRLYLKYYDNVGYYFNGDQAKKDDTVKYPYQKVENFEPIQIKNQSEAMHKSNFFSIRISGTGLENSAQDSETQIKMDNIKFDIENAIKKIVEK